jgi:sarcosine oxidase
VSGYDVIVAGLGAIGSGAAWRLAASGARVLGLDRHQPGHAFGSSHGTSRIIREAYPDGDPYVPLVRRAAALWETAQGATGRPFLHRVGALTLAPADEHRIIGGRRSAARFGIPLEFLEPAAVRSRFPAFRVPDGHVGVFEPGGGYLEPEAGVSVLQRLAAAAGAELRHGAPVLRWEPDGAGVRVHTSVGVERADRLVLTAGPWMPELLGELGLQLRVERRVNVHFRSAATALPIFNLVVPEGQFYGFPAMEAAGLKLGRHDGDAPCTPDTIRRAVGDDEVAAFRAVLDTYLPGAAGSVLRTVTCMYTISPDGHFVVDRHPLHAQVALFTGCSGHAFKFAPALGEVLAQLTLAGESTFDLEPFAATRFAGLPA